MAIDNPIELAVDFFKTIEDKDWHKLSKMLHDDFKYYGPTPDPFDKDIWLSFQKAVGSAFPDWSYNLQKVEQINNAVRVTVHITGTHSEVLDLPWEGAKPIPATGKEVEMPIEHAEVTFKDGQVASLKVEMGPHGSLPGLLEQLGID